ncbi:hypothetical protein COLO4_36529 [Corchorus olitorius]|uniref:Retrotransposon gag protein n=1 Tax=Corchorus olitorius TaxID=93759 RepID=A0A1R3G891_9ROSI|nr:hypothetical protein COLO4_36529 [Corchorus olitorius]
MAPKIDRSDTSITETLHGLTETFNTQFQELRASQIELKQSMDTKLDLAIADFNKKLAIRESPSSSSLPSNNYDGVLGTFPRLAAQNTTDPLFKPKPPKFFLSSFDGSNESFARALEIRFGPPKFLNPQAALFKLRQAETVTQFRRDYEEVITFKPIILAHAFELAKHIESKFLGNRQPPPRAPPRVFQTTAQKPIPPTSYPIRRLSPTEMQARRSKGLCFNCDEQFQPWHRCKTTPFLLLQTEDDTPKALMSLEASETSNYPAHSSLPLPPPPPLPLEPSKENPDFQVSLHALHGTAYHSCLKLKGLIHGHPFTILIDSRSTHNLVQPYVVWHLG